MGCTKYNQKFLLKDEKNNKNIIEKKTHERNSAPDDNNNATAAFTDGFISIKDWQTI